MKKISLLILSSSIITLFSCSTLSKSETIKLYSDNSSYTYNNITISFTDLISNEKTAFSVQQRPVIL